MEDVPYGDRCLMEIIDGFYTRLLAAINVILNIDYNIYKNEVDIDVLKEKVKTLFELFNKKEN